MKLTWLGHASFRLEIENAVILIDPWINGNPSFPAEHRDAAIAGATHILLTHGHGDHAGDAVALSKELSVPVVGIFDLISYWQETQGIEGIGFNKGGTVSLNGAKVSMVPASHSSSMPGPNGPVYTGTEAGYVIHGDGRCIYLSGDTSIIADMSWIGEYYAPDIGILCAGGHFTMDMKGAAWAAKRYFNFKTVIPYHFGTFPLLEQTTDALHVGLPDVEVIDPVVMEPITL